MKTKKFSLLLAGLAFCCSIFLAAPAVARDGGHGKHGNSQHMVQRMTEKLDLSEAQVSQITAIIESHRPNFVRIGDEMKATFTDEQRAAMKEQRKNRKAGGERPSKEERAANMQALGISDGQRAQMKSLREQMKTERQAMKAEIAAVLTPEQQAKAEAMKKNRRGHRGQRGPR